MNWQSRFRDLASRALAIFVVPGLTEGTQWELDRLADDEALQKKSYLIIPNNSYGEIAINALKARGISLGFVNLSQGLLMRCGSPSTRVPIVTYKEITERSFTDPYGRTTMSGGGEVMDTGLRNAIYSTVPGLADRRNFVLKILRYMYPGL